LENKDFNKWVDLSQIWWFHMRFMRTEMTTAFTGTTATAVVFAVAPVAVAYTHAMWSTSAVKHANKRFTRPPCEVSN
jgi:hypothetical protein